jgi:hypothetical protein
VNGAYDRVGALLAGKAQEHPDGIDDMAEAARHLRGAFEHLDACGEQLDEVTAYAVALTRGDVQRLQRRLAGLIARQAEAEVPAL